MERRKAVIAAATASLTLLAGAAAISLNTGLVGASGDDGVGQVSPVDPATTSEHHLRRRARSRRRDATPSPSRAGDDEPTRTRTTTTRTTTRTTPGGDARRRATSTRAPTMTTDPATVRRPTGEADDRRSASNSCGGGCPPRGAGEGAGAPSPAPHAAGGRDPRRRRQRRRRSPWWRPWPGPTPPAPGEPVRRRPQPVVVVRRPGPADVASDGRRRLSPTTAPPVTTSQAS